MSQKAPLPSLTGHRLKTRKRGKNFIVCNDLKFHKSTRKKVYLAPTMRAKIPTSDKTMRDAFDRFSLNVKK